MDEREKYRDMRVDWRKAARVVPLAAVTYGIGYGIARTALDSYLKAHPEKVGPFTKYAPPMVALAAPAAAYLARRELFKRTLVPREEKKS